MSEFHPAVVKLGVIEPLENSDNLSITQVFGDGGYPCIVRRGDFNPGDLACYIPVDSVVPAADARFAFLAGHWRIKARKLRGTFSMGLLLPIEEGMQEGDDIAERWHITKYEAPAPRIPGGPNTSGMRGPCEADEEDPGLIPAYTDIEGLRRYSNLLEEGEEVVITEKIHGENARFVHDGTRLWVGSRTRFKKEDDGSKWWQAARSANLPSKLAQHFMMAVYGESHGYTGGFPYGSANRAATLRLFDAMDAKSRRYLDYDAFVEFCARLELPMVPVLYRGPWSNDLRKLADGQSTLDQSHVREGIVIRPVRERWHPKAGRVILKLHGEAFLLNKHT